MTYSRMQALARALKSTRYAQGMCLQWTRLQYGIAARYPDATTAWQNAEHRHPGDRTPPLGAPVFWTGGSKGHGHVAIYVGDGMIRGTDSPTAGKIGTVPLSYPEQHWGLRYGGWSEDVNGVRIPTAADEVDVVTYNVKAGRGRAAGRDVAAIVAAELPKVLVLQETAGNRLAIWRAVRKLYRRPITGKGADGASTWVLVRRDVKVGRGRLIVSRRLWRGPKGRVRKGRTLPTVVVPIGPSQIALAGVHMQWNRVKNADAYNQLGDQLVDFGNGRRYPVALVGDWNVGPKTPGIHTALGIAQRINGRVTAPGDGVTYAVTRGLDVETELLRELRGGTDHPGPVRVRFTLKGTRK